MASGSTKTNPSHVVVIPLPIAGHTNPLLQLSVQLASLGSDITFITTSSTLRASLSALNHLCDGDQNLRQAIRFQALEVDRNRSEGYKFPESIEIMARNSDEIKKLVAASAREVGPVSLAIIDFLLVEPLESLDCNVAAFWTSSAAMLHISVNVETLLEKGFLPLSRNDRSPEKKVVDSSVIPGIPCELSVFTDIPEDPLDPVGFSSMRKLKNPLLKAPRLLVNTLDEVEEQTLGALREQGFRKLVNVGPLPVGPGSNLEDHTQKEWLDAQEISSALYVCFGTMLELPEEQVMEVGYGLEASQQSFLWVLPESSQRKLGDFLEGLRTRIGKRGLIVSWSSQIDILRHPSVGGFVTHCGWNSTLESLSCGVPMIGWPILGDQPINCKFMVDMWRAGVRIESKSSSDGSSRIVGRSEVERAARSLMGSETLRKRAKEIKSKAMEAMEVSRARLKELL
ncbi:UDP-glycosyltransferase 86A1 [Selaginella moellendorffii]|nr:UDP-glycosyltransferase 86A1 [Selaginella moellendorffii]|eukprot:XP_002969588.2 UDP-glycosyltransferase 86A1 [Selaginella moellendorffii]